MAHESVQALTSAVKVEADEQGGTLSIDTFTRTIVKEVKDWARSKIDTEEERDALIEAALNLADLYVAPRFPTGWTIIRAMIRQFADSAFDGIPDLLAASPPRTDPNTAIA